MINNLLILDNTWKENVCLECNEMLGHCPMRFSLSESDLKTNYNLCLCHIDYNYCIKNNENDEIPEILPNFNLKTKNYSEIFLNNFNSNFNLTNPSNIEMRQSLKVVETMGFDVSLIF